MSGPCMRKFGHNTQSTISDGVIETVLVLIFLYVILRTGHFIKLQAHYIIYQHKHQVLYLLLT